MSTLAQQYLDANKEIDTDIEKLDLSGEESFSDTWDNVEGLEKDRLESINTNVSRDEIVSIVRESRERNYNVVVKTDN